MCDRAMAYIARVSMDVLHPLFSDHLISRFADIPSPPRAHALSIYDYFL